jgi:hypothetical protein
MSVAENKAVVRRYFEEVHNGRLVAVVDEIMIHAFADPTRGVVAAFQTAFPDYRITIMAQVGEEDLIATVWRTMGTHQGEWPSRWGRLRRPASRSASPGRRRCESPRGGSWRSSALTMITSASSNRWGPSPPGGLRRGHDVLAVDEVLNGC